MKICIAATGSNLDASVDRAFGRCAYFLMVDSETEAVKAIRNRAAATARGVGVGAVQIILNAGAKAVICGNIGPKAEMALNQARVRIISEVFGTARQALDKFKAEEF